MRKSKTHMTERTPLIDRTREKKRGPSSEAFSHFLSYLSAKSMAHCHTRRPTTTTNNKQTKHKAAVSRQIDDPRARWRAEGHKRGTRAAHKRKQPDQNAQGDSLEGAGGDVDVKEPAPETQSDVHGLHGGVETQATPAKHHCGEEGWSDAQCDARAYIICHRLYRGAEGTNRSKDGA